MLTDGLVQRSGRDGRCVAVAIGAEVAVVGRANVDLTVRAAESGGMGAERWRD